MPERRIKTRQLRAWIDGANSGDLAARVNLHGYLFPRLLRKEGANHGLVSVTLQKVDQRLPDLVEFCRSVNKRTLSNRLIDWSLVQFDQIARDYTYPPRKFRNQIEDFIPDYPTRIIEITEGLTPTRQEVVKPMVYDGKSIPEIASELDISELAVRQRLHRARVIIEPELMTPFGILRVANLGNVRLQEAASDGYLEGFKFLDLWYTDAKGIKYYQGEDRK